MVTKGLILPSNPAHCFLEFAGLGRFWVHAKGPGRKGAVWLPEWHPEEAFSRSSCQCGECISVSRQHFFFLLQFSLHKSKLKQYSSASKNIHKWVCVRGKTSTSSREEEALKLPFTICADVNKLHLWCLSCISKNRPFLKLFNCVNI